MTLVITEILKEIKKNQGKKYKNKKDAKKGIRTMIKTQLVWPGEAKYPLNNFMEKGCESMKSDLMKLAQILAETLLDEYLYKDDDTTANKYWQRRFWMSICTRT